MILKIATDGCRRRAMLMLDCWRELKFGASCLFFAIIVHLYYSFGRIKVDLNSRDDSVLTFEAIDGTVVMDVIDIIALMQHAWRMAADYHFRHCISTRE
jgi:hypothetical protein